MASLHCQQNFNFFAGNHSPSDNAVNPPSSVPMISREFDVSKWNQWRVSSSSATTTSSIKPRIGIQKRSKKFTGGDNNRQNDGNNGIVYEKLDQWMENSVVEIVKNLKEAPLLVQVYDKTGDSDTDTTTLKTEKSVEEENWGAAVEGWAKKEAPLPEGVIFVEQLDKEESEEEITRAWGVVVQGKGAECGPVCYLLKTSRVGSGAGLCCTHYCLMRVESFRESASSQLKNCWLIQG
ncbi:uncharacterized protein LOC126659616 [Mercurialis annua]|uniref:uncharacterized protein LOC126659616 n=1 Tax=Mercurialis annua TaxID=3986 RepID=UPI00215E4D56|nr:uncharacterized protein LOC126659616 [Mercurialis annua]